MVAIIATVDTATAIQAVANWTTLTSIQSGSNKTIVVYGKVADSADAAATDFTFAPHSGNGGTNDYIAGSLIALSGTFPVSSTAFCDADADTDNGSATQSYTGGVTPGVADNVLIMAGLISSLAGSVSNYAIATDNPTWTERHDTNVNDTNDYTFGVATAPRAAITATGTYQLDASSGTPPSVGVLIAVVEATNVTVSPAVVIASASIQAPTVAASAAVSPSVVTASASIQAPTVTTADSKWVNPNKSTAPSWVNPNKP